MAAPQRGNGYVAMRAPRLVLRAGEIFFGARIMVRDRAPGSPVCFGPSAFPEPPIVSPSGDSAGVESNPAPCLGDDCAEDGLVYRMSSVGVCMVSSRYSGSICII